jgi:hypothetical protein
MAWRAKKGSSYIEDVAAKRLTNYLTMRNAAYIADGNPIAVWLQCITGGSVVNPLVAFYDIHGKRWRDVTSFILWDATRLREVAYDHLQYHPIIWVYTRMYLKFSALSMQIERTCRITFTYILLFPTLNPLSGVGTTCFSSCCDKDSAFVFYDRPPVWRQPSLKLELMLTTANVAGTNSLTCLPNHGGVWDNKFWPPIQWLTSTNAA